MIVDNIEKIDAIDEKGKDLGTRNIFDNSPLYSGYLRLPPPLKIRFFNETPYFSSSTPFCLLKATKNS